MPCKKKVKTEEEEKNHPKDSDEAIQTNMLPDMAEPIEPTVETQKMPASGAARDVPRIGTSQSKGPFASLLEVVQRASNSA